MATAAAYPPGAPGRAGPPEQRGGSRVPDHGPAAAPQRAAPPGAAPGAGRDRPGRGARRRRDLDAGRAARPGLGHGRDQRTRCRRAAARGRPVVLAARNTVAAAGRAVTAASAITRAGAWVAVLVVVSDGLPEPAEARYRFRVLEGRVGAVVRMPFVPAFRVTADPSHVDLPRRARQALAEIRALTREQAPCPAPATRVQGRF